MAPPDEYMMSNMHPAGYNVFHVISVPREEKISLRGYFESPVTFDRHYTRRFGGDYVYNGE